MYVLQYWNPLSAKMFSRKKQWYKIGAKTFPSEHLKLQFMLKMGFWLLMLTGNEFWQDFWETYETSSKYELPQVDATIPSSFYCASVSETRLSHLSPYRSFSPTCIWWAAMQISWNKRKFLLEKRVQSPKDFFYTSTWPPFFCFVHQYGRRDVMWQRSVGRQGVLHLKPAETSANNPCISYFV